MGQFSFVCSDTERALLSVSGLKGEINRKTRDLCTAIAYCLVPADFGGGAYAVDHNYDGYGHFFDMETGKEVDIYEKLAEWNNSEKYADVTKYPLKIVEVLRPYENAKPSKIDNNQGYGYDDEIEDDNWEDTDEY